MSTSEMMNRVKRSVSVEKMLHTDTSELVASAAKGAAVVAGAALAYEIFRHRRLLSVIGVGAAAAVLMKRYLDNSNPHHASGQHTRSSVSASGGRAGPSFPGENLSNPTQTPQDEVDEASMESFPASDPPASYRRA